jgi:glycosyltransferase involved in cell wall biosynthesis
MFSLHLHTAPAWRGGHDQVLYTVMGLRSLGHRAELVAHPDGELQRHAREGLDLIPLAAERDMDFRAGMRLARVLRRMPPDILHAHDPLAVGMASVAISFNSKLPPPRLVATRRADVRVKQNAFSRWKHGQVDAFICTSDATRARVVAEGVPEAQVFTVHEGIDLGRVDAAHVIDVRTELLLPHGAPLIAAVGALVPHKGHSTLIDAMRFVLPQVPDARLVILGEGELHITLDTQVRQLGLESHVRLAGLRPDVLSVLKGADVFVVPATHEGIGTSLLEAMACGLPVVASFTNGISEVIRDEWNGLVVESRNQRALADGLVALLRDAKKRQRFGAANRARVEAHFNADRMVRDTLAVYRLVMGRDH